jgi:hypothetical protein
VNIIGESIYQVGKSRILINLYLYDMKNEHNAKDRFSFILECQFNSISDIFFFVTSWIEYARYLFIQVELALK